MAAPNKHTYTLEDLLGYVRQHSSEALHAIPLSGTYTFQRIRFQCPETDEEKEEELLLVGGYAFPKNTTKVFARATSTGIQFFRNCAKELDVPLIHLQGNDLFQIRFFEPFSRICNEGWPTGSNEERKQVRKDLRDRRTVFAGYVFLDTRRVKEVGFDGEGNVLALFERACSDLLREKEKANAGDDDEDEAVAVISTRTMRERKNVQKDVSVLAGENVATSIPASSHQKRARKAADDEQSIELGVSSPKRPKTYSNRNGLNLRGLNLKGARAATTPAATSALSAPNTHKSLVSDTVTKFTMDIETAFHNLETQLVKEKREHKILKKQFAVLQEKLTNNDNDEIADLELALVEAKQKAGEKEREALEWKSKHDKLKKKFTDIVRDME